MRINVEERLKIIEELNKKDKKDLTAEEKKLIEKEKQRVYRLNKRHNDLEFNERCKNYNKKYYHSQKGIDYHRDYYKNKVENENFLENLKEKNKIKREHYKHLIEENEKLKQVIEQNKKTKDSKKLK